jgi:hypothetical protein
MASRRVSKCRHYCNLAAFLIFPNQILKVSSVIKQSPLLQFKTKLSLFEKLFGYENRRQSSQIMSDDICSLFYLLFILFVR